MKRPPLLSHEDIYGDAGPMFFHIASDVNVANFFVQRYEAARAKDAELIQHLVNALGREVHINQPALPSSIAAFAAAEAAGFKPSQQ
jgi:hypothetical protein